MLRRLQFVGLALALAIAALSTGAVFLWFLLYLGVLLVGGAYVLTRIGLADLEAGYVLDRMHAQAGDALRATYTVRNTSRLPKPWLEAHNPSTLPVAIPGRAISLGPRGERSWSARVPLTRRGHYRVDPLVLRTGDPFGLFESSAAVGTHSTVIVYPRVEALPGWRLPPAAIEGSHAHPVRTPQTTPHATSIRPYAPGDAYNRIHWKSSARQRELQVKEFDLEQTADVWIYLDLYAAVHTGSGDESTLEYAVRAAASIGAHALLEGRALGMTTNGGRRLVVPADRGARQYQKIMQLLAAVEADGHEPLRDVLVDGVSRLRRGMTALVITPSLERDWMRPLVTLRSRGVATVVVLPDAHAFGALHGETDDVGEQQRAARALQHALAEYDLSYFRVRPRQPLAGQLVSLAPRLEAVGR
ncbi:MAG: DUF58 domain-containing protein [Chloroflexota bacterium]|nr:DUF58 domain-containing protein [Chloroflexota bacterium]